MRRQIKVSLCEMASNNVQESTQVETSEVGVECERGSDEQEYEFAAVSQPSYPRAVYLVTYSRANVKRFDRQSFAAAVVSSFEEKGLADAKQWACSMEEHEDGGKHFHIAILLGKQRRWKKVKEHIGETHGICVHFSGHKCYYTAYKYAKKYDKHFVCSPGHPKKIQPPQTFSASSTKKRRKGKAARYTNKDVADLILKENVTSRLQLMALAKDTKKRKGDALLYDFLLAKSEKVVSELIETVWAIETAEGHIERERLTRMEILRNALNADCVCNGEWRQCAQEILQLNHMDDSKFKNVIVELLEKGRGKGRNILITGPANCGKTFILDPLRVIYKCFVNPATCTYALMGVETAEVIIFNDFRFNPIIIPWADLLLLLEGQPVHLSTPKTHFAKDIVLDSDTPVFCTSKGPILYVKGGSVDDRESEMMRVRWRHIEFRHQIEIEKQKCIQPCAYCFSHFLLDGHVTSTAQEHQDAPQK